MHINDFKKRQSEQKASSLNNPKIEMKVNNPTPGMKITGFRGQSGMDVKDGLLDGMYQCIWCGAISPLSLPTKCPARSPNMHQWKKLH